MNKSYHDIITKLLNKRVMYNSYLLNKGIPTIYSKNVSYNLMDKPIYFQYDILLDHCVAYHLHHITYIMDTSKGVSNKRLYRIRCNVRKHYNSMIYVLNCIFETKTTIEREKFINEYL